MEIESKKIEPWIILLSGPTSSGKTTLAQALQKRLSIPERPFLHVEADVLGVPNRPEHWDEGKEKRRFGRAFRRSVVAYLREGYDIILDGILPYGDSELLSDGLDLYRAHRLCYVGVRCSLRTLEERVSGRQDRDFDFARRQHRDIHEGQTYDVEIDTSEGNVDAGVEEILAFLRRTDKIQ